MAKSARAVVLDELVRWETAGEWDNRRFSAAIAAAGLDRRDAALATFLAGGVMQNRILVDWWIAKFSKIPLGKLERRVLMALRLGAFQLFFADSIPKHAAVSETVALMSGRDRRSAGFVNAILRALSKVDDPFASDARDDIERLSIRYSHPEWIVRELVGRKGLSGAEAELEANNSSPPTTLRVNTRRTDRASLMDELSKDGAEVSEGLIPSAITMVGGGDVAELESFRKGKFWVQDVSSQLAGAALGVGEGMRVLDLCAAPGGKSFGAACAGGLVTSNDLTERKTALIRDGAARLGFDIEVSTRDGREPPDEWLGAFDRVICDAPCSGLGIIRKKPDIRYKTASDIEKLPELQLELLESAARCVKNGGKLLYSTCTWRKEENENVVEVFLSKHPEFLPEDFDLPNNLGGSTGGMTTFWSEKNDRDGFYVCIMRRKDV